MVPESSRSERSFRQFFELSMDLCCIAGTDGFFRAVNSAFVQTLGFSEEELRSRPFVEFVHPDDRRRTLAELGSLGVGGSTVDFQNRYICKDGSFRWLEWRSLPANEDGLVFAVARDVTERLQAQQKQRAQERDLQQLDRATTIGELATQLAHELNQPLAAILNYAHGCIRRLSSSDSHPDVVEALEQVCAQAQHAGRVTQRIREFVQDREPVKENVDLVEVTRDAVALAAPEAERQQVDLRVNPDRPEVLAWIDGIQFQQVILNLVQNAIEAAAASAATPAAVVLRLGPAEDGGAYVTVLDTGPGFDREVADKVFEAFFSTKPRGMGLGLSISRSIVEAHGGRLWVDPDCFEGGGCVHLTIPPRGV